MTTQSPHSYLLSLDSLGLPFLCFDAEFQPSYLNSEAAKLLEIRNRTNVEEYSELIEPLCVLIRSAASSSSSKRKLSPQQYALTPHTVELKTNSGRCFQALCNPREIQLPKGDDLVEAWAVSFRDLSPLEPFLQSIEQTRRQRSLVVLAASILDRTTLIDNSGEGFIKAYQDLQAGLQFDTKSQAVLCRFATSGYAHHSIDSTYLQYRIGVVSRPEGSTCRPRSH